ncbi:FHA domain-containing protein [Actinophytocola oryzae]|uniref:FHA domain-containing protein n=1 Tax=Actinophytocola oryzae TaxID=502181 RepID=A0A4R7URH3_9PSEU|nr:FHA domain-containing protein [Actinophytocola oryzae]TDV34885.1 FHA domain-containing protein [Actinophytocola oryzae]
MATCPLGHTSTDEEFCEVCGREIGGAPVSATADAPPATEAALPPAGTTCQSCGAALAGRFCEECGHDSLAPVPERVPVAVSSDVPPVPADRMPEEATWTATVTADRAYYGSVMEADGPDASGITFPPYCPDRHFPLAGKEISIGRSSRSRGILPDIDLLGPPEDPGVSHLHALLLAQADGTWSIVDLDSANGTLVNDEQKPLRPNVPRPLADGDRVYIGAWTRITLRHN